MKRRGNDAGRARRGFTVTATVGAIVVLVLGGCATLPGPRGESDTALVIPVVREGDEAGRSPLGYLEVAITRSGDPGFRYTTRIDADTEVAIVTGLEPGRYWIESYRLRYHRGGTDGSVREIRERFVLEPGALTVAPVMFTLRRHLPEGESRSRLQTRYGETTARARERTLALLEEEDPGSFARWRVLSARESSAW
jgi:hypothetical protein